jgi:hypothetical protein
VNEEDRALATLSARDLVAYIDDDSLRDLLMQLALHPLRVGLGIVSGVMAAVLYLIVSGRNDLAMWVGTLGPFGTALACHVILRATWARLAGDAGLNRVARARLRELIARAPVLLSPTSASVDELLRHLRR